MKQVQITAYSFDELSDRAKDKVRCWINDGINLLDYCDAGYLIPKDELFVKEYVIGSYDVDHYLYFSTFDLDIANYLESTLSVLELRNIKRIAQSLNESIGGLFYLVKNHNYRETLLEFDIGYRCFNDRDRYYRTGNLLDQVTERLTDHLRECEHLARIALRDEIESMYSDECIKDTCEANGYLFDKHGNLV